MVLVKRWLFCICWFCFNNWNHAIRKCYYSHPILNLLFPPLCVHEHLFDSMDFNLLLPINYYSNNQIWLFKIPSSWAFVSLQRSPIHFWALPHLLASQGIYSKIISKLPFLSCDAKHFCKKIWWAQRDGLVAESLFCTYHETIWVQVCIPIVPLLFQLPTCSLGK